MVFVTYSTCVVVSPGSVTIPHITMGLLANAKSLQLMPSLQLYLLCPLKGLYTQKYIL